MDTGMTNAEILKGIKSNFLTSDVSKKELVNALNKLTDKVKKAEIKAEIKAAKRRLITHDFSEKTVKKEAFRLYTVNNPRETISFLKRFFSFNYDPSLGLLQVFRGFDGKPFGGFEE